MFDKGKKDEVQSASDEAAQRLRDQQQRASQEFSASGDRSQVPSSGVAVIGRSIQIDGELRGEEDLRIEGNVNGKIHLENSSLTVGAEGRVKADIFAKAITVDGQVEGDLFGLKRVSIRARGQVIGNIIAGRIVLDEGASFKGSVDMDPERVEAAFGIKKDAKAGAKAATDKPAAESGTAETGAKAAAAAVRNIADSQPDSKPH